MAEAAVLMAAEGLVLAPGRAPIDDEVRAGEIVGLAGLEGHGQERFLETLAGLHRPVEGRVTVADDDGTRRPVTSFRQATAHRVGYLPRDRRTTGIFPGLSILDNFAIASIGRDSRFGLIDAAARRRRYAAWHERLRIVAPSPEAPIGALSGGNQQKVLLARWLARDPRVLLLNDPTRGVDIGTRRTLYGVFRALADDGLALVVLSTENEEIMELCDRVLVFRDREVSARLAGETMTVDATIAAMFGRAA